MRRILVPALLLAFATAAAAELIPAAGSRFAASPRPGFSEWIVADSLDSPVSMALAPDGRVFVCEQAGALRVVRDGRLLPQPFVTVPTQAFEEEGLLGVAFPPDFARTHHVYVVYTAAWPNRHNVIARFTASGDTAAAGSERIVYEFDAHSGHQHLGGALAFGRDGYLYASSGEDGEGGLSQSLASTAGKVIRIRRDGSIPADNPFRAQTQGRHGAIWARGFRNAFRFDIHPRTGRMFVNDVGGSRYEEVDQVKRGDNHGWPIAEGPGPHGEFTDPVYAYDHSQGCAITGGAFYAPARPTFPERWRDGYFFTEYCANEIRWLDPAHPSQMTVFGRTRVPGPVDVRVGRDGSLWYLARGNSAPTGGPGTGWGVLVNVRPEAARVAKPAGN